MDSTAECNGADHRPPALSESKSVNDAATTNQNNAGRGSEDDDDEANGEEVGSPPDGGDVPAVKRVAPPTVDLAAASERGRSGGAERAEMNGSRTPRGDKRAAVGTATLAAPRSKSEDEADPDAAPLLVRRRMAVADRGSVEKQNGGALEPKETAQPPPAAAPSVAPKKKTKRKRTKKRRRKKGDDSTFKAVTASNAQKYTTESLQPPNLQHGGHRLAAPPPSARGQQHHSQHPLYPPPQQQHHHHHHGQQQQQSFQQQRWQQRLLSSSSLLVDPYRQFCIAFDRRPFGVKLQYRNGFALLSGGSELVPPRSVLTAAECVWGWYSVERHDHIPVGSKLMAVNMQPVHCQTEQEMARLLYALPLPTTLVFEAPSYCQHTPPSIHCQLSDAERGDAASSDHRAAAPWPAVEWLRDAVEPHRSLLFWWLEDGGAAALLLVAAATLRCGVCSYFHLWILVAALTLILHSVPPLELAAMGWAAAQRVAMGSHSKRRRRGSGLTLFGRKVVAHKDAAAEPLRNGHIAILREDGQPLLAQFAATTRHQNRESADDDKAQRTASRHRKRRRKRQRERKVSAANEDIAERPKDGHFKEEEKLQNADNASVGATDPAVPGTVDVDCGGGGGGGGGDSGDVVENGDSSLIHRDDDGDGDGDGEQWVDSEWERRVCFPSGNSEEWGSYGPCSAKTLKLRGKTYLADRIKIQSEEDLLSFAKLDMFTVHQRIRHMAQSEFSWFHQHRHELPRSLFFLIFHLRLDSMTASVVQYFYIDKRRWEHLLESNERVREQRQQKGAGYFAIGGRQFDESGLFWNFINGPCQFRNERLKLLARKEEGPWYMQIPSRPAILGRQVPIEYYRGYDARHFNATKSHNTRSEAEEPYDFQTLWHDPERGGNPPSDRPIPCDCGKCRWVDTEGEYPEYLEIDITPEVNNLAKNTVRMACPLAKSLQVEMHWTLEGQNKEELPERMLCSARLIHVDLAKLMELD